MTSSRLSHTPLPPVLAGPLLRRVQNNRLVLWLAASRPLPLQLHLSHATHAGQDSLHQQLALDEQRCQRLPLGQHLWLHLIDVALDRPLPWDTLIHYDLEITDQPGAGFIRHWAPQLLYPGHNSPNFVIRQRLDHLLHGSCRKPHHPGADGLLQADQLLLEPHSPAERPAVLLMTGDQIYADDVAGPLLAAIHQLIARLGLYGEPLEGARVNDSRALYQHPATYYRREDLLPAYQSGDALRERFFGGVRKPIFTTANAHNHLITLAEVVAMYLLVWSPTPWELIQVPTPELPAHWARRYRQEAPHIQSFASGLPGCARAMAHLPCLMIFDDHDVTDDWNLSASWEDTVYQHPFSRRIVGNALLGYLLFQGWGNAPEHFEDTLPALRTLLTSAADSLMLDQSRLDKVITQLLSCRCWHYSLPTQPPLLVLDTRTRRWRNEDIPSRPSGLMDWEALCELQNTLLDKPSAIIVSPAPMFGVKLIETVQRLFTWAGYPLLVDAENWMAHRGAAMSLLNIFCHSRTPAHYLVLSGDVHYSFTYRISIRHRRQDGPKLWQITSSGIKNEFPPTLLRLFDRLNRHLYGPHSWLNRFTKRRHLDIHPCLPDSTPDQGQLWNHSGLGQVYLDIQGRPTQVQQRNADGSRTGFQLSEQQAH